MSTNTESYAEAKRWQDLLSPNQLRAIRSICNAHGINAVEHCVEVFGCAPERLAKTYASEFIDYLNRRTAEQGQVAEPPTPRNVRFIHTRYDGRCAECGESFSKGEQIFWLPSTATERAATYCVMCGDAAGFDRN